MSNMAQALGIPVEFEFDGTIYRLSAFDFECEGLYERWLERQAFELIQRNKEIMSQADWLEQMDGWRRDGASQEFTLSTKSGYMSQFSIAGQKQKAFLQLAKGSQNIAAVDMDLIECIFDDDDAKDKLLVLMKQADADPNRSKPFLRRRKRQLQPATGPVSPTQGRDEPAKTNSDGESSVESGKG